MINLTPYNKDYVENSEEIKAYVDANYAVVFQDVKGRYHSEGMFVPYEYETEDGLELFKWIRKQKWCNGRLGTFGASYYGGIQ